jgi:hypothetical protein
MRESSRDNCGVAQMTVSVQLDAWSQLKLAARPGPRRPDSAEEQSSRDDAKFELRAHDTPLCLMLRKFDRCRCGAQP